MKEEEAIILMEPGAELSDEQLAEVAADADLRQACEDLFVATSLTAREQEAKPDVEAALQRFHARHRKTRLSWTWTAVAAAAAVVAVVVILWPASLTTQLSPLNSQSIVFAADEGQPQVSVKTADGKVVPVSIVKSKDEADATLVATSHPSPLSPVVSLPNRSLLAIASHPSHLTPIDIDEHYNVSVPYGESLCMVLEDGTRVFLHPGSRLVYPTHFIGKEREVQFSGEAYFCVAKDPKRPFVVHSIEGDIRVYGTEFNVVSGKRLEVVLVEGCVGVTPMTGDEQKIKPGEMLSIVNSQLSIRDVDVEPYISWRDGYFHFEEETLGNILQKLGRYYNMNVVCCHPEQLGYRMRFIIPRNRDAAYCVDMLNRMGKAHVVLHNHSIMVE